MDLTNIPIFKMVVGRMGWLAKRQEVLAQNIANSDTPGYVPKDLKKQDFGKFLRPREPQARMVQTSGSHMQPTQQPSRIRHETDRSTYEIAPTGNAVIVEEQLMKVADTQGAYRLATNLYAKHVSLLKQAIGRDNG